MGWLTVQRADSSDHTGTNGLSQAGRNIYIFFHYGFSAVSLFPFGLKRTSVSLDEEIVGYLYWDY